MNSVPQLTGRDLGRRVVAGIRGYISRVVSALSERIDELQRALNDTPTMAMVREEVSLCVSAVVDEKYNDGAQKLKVELILELVSRVGPIIESEVRRWEIDFERRASDILSRAIENTPKPKDGNSIEDFDVELLDDDTIVISMKINGEIVQRSIELPIPLYHGVYQPGKLYKRGAMVTFSGSVFSALKNTEAKPGESTDWQLAVKRGRDGKQGA